MNSLAPIKNWKPRHENIVILHLNGWSNIAIADYIGITPQRVCQVLDDAQAKAIVKETISRVRENLSEDTADRLLKMTGLAVDRIYETLEMTFVPGTDPKKHQDNVSLQILKGKGFLPGGGDEAPKNKEQQIPVSLLERFTSALEKSNEAKRLNAGDSEENEEEEEEIQEAEFVVEDKDPS